MEDREARPWKRRRRRVEAVPTHTKLTFDERMRGDVGVISQTLCKELFRSDFEQASNEQLYIAVCPWPAVSEDPTKDLSWSILPVKTAEASSDAPAIRFPAKSRAIQNLLQMLQSSVLYTKYQNAAEVLVVDVEPLELDAVFLKVDGEALRKHHDVQRKFGGGFLTPTAGQQTRSKMKATDRKLSDTLENASLKLDADQTSRLKEAVRSSLGRLPLIHCHDLLPLSLPSHPITHVPFPPVEILMCEPVSQGLVSSNTEIFIEISHSGSLSKSKHSTFLYNAYDARVQDRIISEEEGDTTDQFYSAAENDELDEDNGDVGGNGTLSPEIDGSDYDSNSSDDDSPENTISLNSPTLPSQASGILSSRTAATPRPFSIRGTGANSPGSVYSSFTATTANQRGQRGRAFQVKPLVTSVSELILHPRPKIDEDDEARVFVDVKMLVRLGCFSGDWVKIIVSESKDTDPLWDATGFHNDEDSETFRPVKIYGLPDLSSEDMPSYPKTEFARRQSHHSTMLGSRPLPSAFISPILFANLGEPKRVTIALLPSQSSDDQRFSKSKVPSTAIPPIAKELILFRVPTPIATERATSAGILANLKDFFESRRRLVQEGDIVAIKIDATLSRILSEGGSQLEVEEELEELLQIESNGHSKRHLNEVAWFKIGKISGVYPDDIQAAMSPELWGGVASAEPMTTKMFQAGSESMKLPPFSTNPWPYYLRSRNSPPIGTSKKRLLLAQEDLPKRYASPLQKRVRELLAAATSPRATRLHVEPLGLLIHSTQRGMGKRHLVSTACADIGLHFYPVDSYDILSEGAAGGDVKTEGYLRKKIEFAMSCGVDLTVPMIQHVEALTADRMSSTIKDLLKDVKVLAFTTTELDKVPENIRSLFTHEIEVSAPDEREREGILGNVVRDRAIELAHDVDLANVAVRTAALVAGDLVDVVERAVIVKGERLDGLAAKSPNCLVRDVIASGGVAARCITKEDFNIAIDVARKNFADAIGAPKIPNVTWHDVGGLSHVKDAVMETIKLPLERPGLFASGMKKRSGILFYGPPGTGKTLVAKAIATEFSLNFFSIKGPELLNMYIGESEANVRRVFQKARDARPCVVFFDELDSVAPKRGNQGDSGGVMDRIVSQLLAELDGMSEGKGGSGGVFVIGATNRPDLLDQALLRPGRFDKMLYLGVSDTHDKQLAILEALTRKFVLHPDLSLRRVAEKLPFTYTGADLYALCSDAMLKAITRKAAAVDAKIKTLPGGPITTAQFFDHYATEEDTAVTVTEDDFLNAKKELVSSVRYAYLQARSYFLER